LRKKWDDSDTHYARDFMGAGGRSALWFQAYVLVPNGYGGLILWDVGGSLEPKVVNQANQVYQYHLGRDWIARKASQFAAPSEVMRPDGSDVRPLTSYSDQGARVVNDKVVFRAKTPTGFGLFLWTEDLGEQLLLEYPYSEQKKIYELAADEEWMTYQVEDTSTDPPTAEIFASPFPNTVGEFSPVRLRSTPWTNPGGSRPVIGCGYMGRQGLIRLDDGTLFLPPTSSGGWEWSDPAMEREWHMEILGITCTEVFTLVRIRPTEDPSEGYVTVGRLPISSLIEGIPPD
jgi:hypothetical protein